MFLAACNLIKSNHQSFKLPLNVLGTRFLLHFYEFYQALSPILHIQTHVLACPNLVVTVAQNKQVQQRLSGFDHKSLHIPQRHKRHLFPHGNICWVLVEVLSLSRDYWYIEIDQTVHSRQQVIAGVFDPALLRIGYDDYAAKKHHSL